MVSWSAVSRWRAFFLLAVAALGLDACYWSPAIRIWVPLLGVAWVLHALRHGSRSGTALACALCGSSASDSWSHRTTARTLAEACRPGRRGDSAPGAPASPRMRCHLVKERRGFRD